MTIVSVPYPTPAFGLCPRDQHGITDLIVHHSAGPISQTPLQIDAEHRGNGWAMIGYNFIITSGGVVYTGRPIDVVPAAAYGRNTQSVNVVLLGNFQRGDPGFTGVPSPMALAALRTLAVTLHQRLPSIVRTIGHRDVATTFYGYDPADYSTACPGSELYAQLPALRSFIASALRKVA